MVTRPFRLAALDIGSLTVRLGIAESRSPTYPPWVLLRREATTRLGAGVSTTRRLSPQAQADTTQVLEEYTALCRLWQVERVVAVATQAVRQAENQEDFLRRVSMSTGLTVEVLSPETEVNLCVRGILTSLVPDIAAHRPLVIFDLGGGSLEWAFFFDQAPPTLLSLPFGALTLVTSWPSSDPPRAEDLITLDRCIRRDLLPLKTLAARLPCQPASRLVGSGGVITTLAAMHLGLSPYRWEAVDNLQLTRDTLAGLRLLIHSLPLSARSCLPGLSPAKADVIIPGAAIIAAILELCSADEVTVMDAGLLEGVLGRLADQVLDGRI